MRLQLANALLVNFFDPDLVFPRPLTQFFQTGQLAFIRGDDQLTHAVKRQTMLGAELFSRPNTFPAKSCFLAARRVVDTGMDNARVVPGLMCRGYGFFFQQDNRTRWVARL